MAELYRDGETLVLKLAAIEKVEGIHGDIKVLYSSIQKVTVIDDIINAVHGFRMPGSGIPGIFAMGTFISEEGTDFVMVHHHIKRGVRVDLKGTSYHALIVSVEDPEQLLATLGFSNA